MWQQVVRRQAENDSLQVLDGRMGRQRRHHLHLHHHHHVLDTLVALCSTDPPCACEKDACEGENELSSTEEVGGVGRF